MRMTRVGRWVGLATSSLAHGGVGGLNTSCCLMFEAADNLKATRVPLEESVYEGRVDWWVNWTSYREKMEYDLGAFVGVETLGDGFLGLWLGRKIKRKINRSMWLKLRIIGNTWPQEIKTRKHPIWHYLFTYSIDTVGSAFPSHIKDLALRTQLWTRQ